MKEMTRRTFVGTAGLAAVSPTVAFGSPSRKPQAPTRVERDVPFGRGGDLELKLDVHHPRDAAGKRMAIVYLHGGGFARGSKETLNERVQPYVERGYVAVVSQYRLTGEARWPAQIHDVKAAIRWTRAHADDLGVMPERIGVAGFSAGGQLALFAAGTGDNPDFEGDGGSPGVSSQVACCAAYYPGTEVRMGRGGSANGLLPEGSDEAAHVAASPTTHAAGSPPTILFHGTEDTTISPDGSIRYHQMLQEAGIPSELHIYSGVPHVFDSNPEFAQAAAAAADFFIDRYVLDPRTYPPFGGGGRGA